ncbi:MAG: DUF5661 family protein [Candidatus Thorarchaeota archaeon]
MAKDKIPGGLAEGKKIKFNKKQLRKGIKVEMEHTNDPAIAREIAKDHLVEDPKYYDKLEKMEKASRFAHIFWKLAQDPELDNPNIVIQPGRPEADCALEILKLWKPNYFVGIRQITISPSASYGHVESGPDKDPTVIHINADRIVQEAGQQQGKGAALACARVIAHEKGHVASFDPQQGFQGGEAPAERQEQDFDNWLNSGGMQQVENLPCFRGL